MLKGAPPVDGGRSGISSLLIVRSGFDFHHVSKFDCELDVSRLVGDFDPVCKLMLSGAETQQADWIGP
jgi:hypothetical protein